MYERKERREMDGKSGKLGNLVQSELKCAKANEVTRHDRLYHCDVEVDWLQEAIGPLCNLIDDFHECLIR